MDLQLDGKLALVSGSTAGIGYAIARTLAQEGAHVIVNGRSQAAVGATRLLVRSNSTTPNSSSSLRTCTERVGWLMPQASAARPKCACSATASR